MTIVDSINAKLRGLDRRSLVTFGLLALAALALRFYLAPQKGSEYDLGAFSYWAVRAGRFGFFGFYGGPAEPKLSFPNYALYFPVLALMGSAAQATTEAGRMLLKTPAILGDIILAAVVYFCAKPKWKIAASAFVLFNPAIWYNSAVFGQTDCLHTAFMALAVLAAADRKYRRSWIFAALAVFFKIQAIAILPLLFAANWKDIGLKKMIKAMVPAMVLAAAVSAPYVYASSLNTIWHSLFRSVGMFPLVSTNAWNPWFLMHMFSGRWVHDTETILGVNYQQIGLFAFALAAAAIIHALPRRSGRTMMFAAAGVMYFAFYLLLTEMHERYLYPFIPFIAVIIGESPLVACLAAVASVGLFLDINFVQTWSPLLTPFVSTATDGIFWSFVFIIMFAVLLRWYLRRAMEAKKAAAVTGE